MIGVADMGSLFNSVGICDGLQLGAAWTGGGLEHILLCMLVYMQL